MKNSDSEQILGLIAQFAEGARVDDVLKVLKPKIHPRTLQRKLKSLVAEGRLVASGNTRSRRYHIPVIKPSKGAQLVLSKQGESLFAKIDLPIELRKKVGYQRKLLDKYRPNQDFYLPSKMRSKLKAMGKGKSGDYPAGTLAHRVFHRLLVDLSWNSSRLEGNTYSLLETERIIEQGIIAEGKGAKETQMILNHKAAIEFLVDSADEIGVNRFTLLNLHALLADNLLSDSACGALRKIPVGIAESVYVPISIPQVIEEEFERLLKTAREIKDPIEQAFFLMVHLPYLQPFEDVNKRTSRLGANIPLIKHNLCPLSFMEVSDETYISGLLAIYELNRFELMADVFEWAYERSCYLYSEAREVVQEPDQFRLEHRDKIIEVIYYIVSNSMNKAEAVRYIQSINMPKRFSQVCERELQSLHVGSIARYKLNQNQFHKWKKVWDDKSN